MPPPSSQEHHSSRALRRTRSTAAAIALLVPLLVMSLGANVSAQPSPAPTETPMPAATPAPSAALSPSPAPSAAPSQAPASTAAPGATAVAWEYRTLFVTWDANILDWVADFSDGTRIQGLDPILNNEGRHGWELVAVVPELWTQIVDDAIREDARRLRIFLKKPLG
jgi:hypothetical protein